MMRIVLRSDVPNLGKRGDICDVADGYARNFLLPKGHAIPANSGIAQQAATMRKARETKDAHDRQVAEGVARSLVQLVIRVPMRAGPREGSSGRSRRPISRTRSPNKPVWTSTVIRIQLEEPIKTLGTHEVPVRLHSEVEFPVTVEVVRT